MKNSNPLRGKTSLLLAVAMALVLPEAPALAGQEIISVPTRPGVTVQVFLNTPATPAKAVVVMFPGKDGAIMRVQGNFLVRTSPKFAQQGLAVAIVDAPSDQPSGMSAGFRKSPEHTQDIRKIIDFLDAQRLKPIYLVANSLGTVSVAYLGMELQDSRIKGLVFTSTVVGSGVALGSTLSRITLPVLIVHHRDDGCKVSPFLKAVELKKTLSGSPRVDLVEVQGGGGGRESDPCTGMGYHGFLGREDEVVQLIANWIAGKQVPAQIGK